MQWISLCPKVLPSLWTPDNLIPKTQTLWNVRRCSQCDYPFTDRPTCPRCDTQLTETMGPLGPDTKRRCLDMVLQRRDRDISDEYLIGGDKMTLLGQTLKNLEHNMLTRDIGKSHKAISPHYLLTPLVPLDQCILAIVWELIEDQSSSTLGTLLTTPFNRSAYAPLEFLVVVLRSAAIYQAKLETVWSQILTLFFNNKTADHDRIRIN
jgi:hypothetical protein